MIVERECPPFEPTALVRSLGPAGLYYGVIGATMNAATFSPEALGDSGRAAAPLSHGSEPDDPDNPEGSAQKSAPYRDRA